MYALAPATHIANSKSPIMLLSPLVAYSSVSEIVKDFEVVMAMTV